MPHCVRPSNLVRRVLLLAASCLLVLGLAFPARAAGSLLILDYPEFWPFFSMQENGEMTGFFYEIVTEAMERMDVAVRWRAFPWARCQANVEAGDSEAMITVPTPERLEYTETHPDPFYLKQLSVFTYKDHPQLGLIQNIRTLDDVKRMGLTVVTYVKNGWNDRNVRSRKIKIYVTPLIRTVWPMLAARRGDIAIEWSVAAWSDIRKMGVSDRIIETDVTFEPMPFHLLISRKSPMVRLLPEFNRIILEMKKSGRIDEIVAKYTR